MIKLSIIVPIYGVEHYLRKCVDSLLAQDYDNYEIILVDDGSTDNSGAICDEYASPSFINSLTRSVVIKVIHRKNGGLSAARNSGIEIAQGDYLMFVDSDDYIEPNVLGVLVRTMEEKQLDVLRYNYRNVRIVESQESKVKSKYEVFEPHKNAKPYFDYSSEIEDGETFLNKRLGYACYAWAFVLRRDLIIESQESRVKSQESKVESQELRVERQDCLFTEGIYFEDTDWTPRMLLRAKRVSSTEKVVYNYLWREGSITLPDNPIKKKKVLEDKIKLLYGFKEHQKQANDRNWFIWQTAGTTMSILGILSTYPSSARKPYLRQLKSLDIFPLSTYRASKNSKIKIMLANLSPAIFCKLMNIIRK